jgi:hypothetical protein
MSKKINLSEKEIAEIRKKHETERSNYEFFSKKVFEPKKKLDEQTVSSVVSAGISKGKEEADGSISFSATTPSSDREIAAKKALQLAETEGYSLSKDAKTRLVEKLPEGGYRVTYYFNKS